MAHHEAIFRFSTCHAAQIYRSLAPELSDEVNSRSVTTCWLEGESMLVFMVDAQDTASLRAALNMFLRLVNVSSEMMDLV
jgi:KEOPS complex subunit Pcc1